MLDRRYVYDGWRVVLELDGLNSNAILRKYTWGLDLAGLGGAGVPPANLDGAGGIGGLLAVHDTNGTTTGENPEADDLKYVYTYDANGNVGQLIDPDVGSAASSIKAHYEYDPYGGVVASSGTYAATNTYRFSTKPWDDETGLGYWGYRYYDPRLGRWISRDPISEEGGVALYSYMHNRPNSGIDPVGLTPCTSRCGDEPCNNPTGEHDSWCACIRDCRLLDQGDALACLADAGKSFGTAFIKCTIACAPAFKYGFPGWKICMAGCVGADTLLNIVLTAQCIQIVQDTSQSAHAAYKRCISRPANSKK
ncbi:tRNA3(Ser)-specific nuclease WapA precursor [Phycisphaerae bacterium RAS1]|nr:tRNA3(Ser)-specific nuclease WapA precursor [Phycisphaerae bacterium RAS1]